MSYGKSSKERMAQEKTGGGEFWTPPEGDTRIRVMPPASEDAEDFWFRTGTHFGVGPDERAVPCPLLAGVRDSCYLCQLVKKLSRGDEDEQAEADAMGASPRYLISIVDYTNPAAGVQVWRCPIRVFRKLQKYRLNEDDYGDMTDLEHGYDITVNRTGGGLKTEYDVTPARKNSPFPPEKFLEFSNEAVAQMYQAIADQEFELPDLVSIDVFMSDADTERIYKGLSVSTRTETEEESETEEPEEVEEEEQPVRRRERRGQAASSEERPARAARRSSRRQSEPEPEEAKTSPSRLRGRVRDL